MDGLIYIAGSGVVLFLLFKFAKRIFFKLLLILVLIALAIFGLYYFKIGPFQSNLAHIEVVKDKYCTGKTPEICDCIVNKLEADIKSRFDHSEINEMKEDRIKCAYVFQKSMAQIATEAKSCLKQTDNEKLWSLFIKETLQVNNSVTEKIEYLLKEGKTVLDEKVDDVKGKKEDLDGRY
ncbi:hypothetical protein OAB01_03370 [Bacteroidia bacterium]|nr:hypothetical protein [Bacteroidia bacterium]